MAKTQNQTETETETTDLATIDASQYAIVQAGGMANLAILRENLGDDQLDVTDMDRVGMPAGGGLQWEIPTLNGEESAKSIEGVIVAHKLIRLYWSKDIDEGGAGNPPDCFSHDSHEGVGTPGGQCHRCLLAQWGSAKNGEGRGQACKLVRQLFVMRQGDILPIAVNLPPSSLQAAKQYLLKLALRGRKFHSVITKFTLERDSNTDGITYSKVKLRPGGLLGAEDAAFFEKLNAEIKALVSQVVIDGSEYTVHEEEDVMM